MKKNRTLLQPFDLKAAKKGEKICWSHIEDPVTYIGSNSKGQIAFESGTETNFTTQDQFRMAPLAWVEGRPVYKEDVLFYNKESTYPGSKFIAKNYHRWGIAGETYFIDGRIYDDEEAYELVKTLTWEKPATKQEAWINIYPDKHQIVYRYPTKERALIARASNAITTLRIEWEE